MSAEPATTACRACGRPVLPYMHADCHPCTLDDYCSTCATRDASDLEFATWFDGNYGSRWTHANWAGVRVIAQAAFHQGLAVGREGRA